MYFQANVRLVTYISKRRSGAADSARTAIPQGRTPHAIDVHVVAAVRRVDGEDEKPHSNAETGSSILKKILAAAAMASLAGLTACSVATPAPDSTTSTAAPAASAPASSQASPSRSSDASAAPRAGGAKAACETFNSLYVDLRAAANDANAFEDVYLAAQDAKDTVSGNLVGLFTSIGVLALDHATEVETGKPVDQASKDAIRDAVFANAEDCTAEGVTLRL